MPFLMIKTLPRYECLLAAAKEFPDLDPWACAVYLHLLRAGDEVFQVAERNLNRHAISPGRFGVLMLLWGGSHARSPEDDGDPPPRTPAELAEAAGVTMTGLIRHARWGWPGAAGKFPAIALESARRVNQFLTCPF